MSLLTKQSIWPRASVIHSRGGRVPRLEILETDAGAEALLPTRSRAGRVRLLIGSSAALSTCAGALLRYIDGVPRPQPTDFISSKIGWIPIPSPHFQDGQLSHHGCWAGPRLSPQSGSGLIGSESPARPVADRGGGGGNSAFSLAC